MDSPTPAKAPQPEDGPKPALRRSLQIPLPVETVVKGDRPRFLGYVSNVSETGIFVQSTNPKPVGTRASLRMRLPGHPKGLELKLVEVVWHQPYEGRESPSPGMGIRLVEVGENVRKALQAFCAEEDPVGVRRLPQSP